MFCEKYTLCGVFLHISWEKQNWELLFTMEQKYYILGHLDTDKILAGIVIVIISHPTTCCGAVYCPSSLPLNNTTCRCSCTSNAQHSRTIRPIREYSLGIINSCIWIYVCWGRNGFSELNTCWCISWQIYGMKTHFGRIYYKADSLKVHHCPGLCADWFLDLKVTNGGRLLF